MTVKNEIQIGVPEEVIRVINGLKKDHPFLADALMKHKRMLWYKLSQAQRTTGIDAMDLFQDITIDLWNVDRDYPTEIFHYAGANYNFKAMTSDGFCVIENRKTRDILEVPPAKLTAVKKTPYTLLIKIKIDQLLANVIASASCQKRGASVKKVSWDQQVSNSDDNELTYEDVVEDTLVPTPEKEYHFNDFYKNFKNSMTPLASRVVDHLLKQPPGPSHRIVKPVGSNLRSVMAAKREVRQAYRGISDSHERRTDSLFRSLASKAFKVKPIHLDTRCFE